MKKVHFYLLTLLLLFTLLCSCKKERMPREYDSVDMVSYGDLVAMLNENTSNLQQFAHCYLKRDKLVSCFYQTDRIHFLFESGTEVLFYSLEKFDDSVYPCVSMVLSDSVFLWTLNNELVTDCEGDPYQVDDTCLPELSFKKGIWQCFVQNDAYLNIKKMAAWRIQVDKDETGCFIIVSLPTGCVLALPLSDYYSQLRPVVPNRAYYKDMFLDSGYGLTSRKRLPASTHLGLSVEGMSFSSEEEIDFQNQLIEGDPDDLNGRLLYPDGQPRYRLLFVNGGKSKIHGQSLSEQARENMRAFNQNGGSYVGTCAGAFFASNGDNSNPLYPYYLHIWPQVAKRTYLSQTYTGFYIEPDSPLLSYFDFGGDLYVDSVRHNGGCYADEQPLVGEVLARYDYPEQEDMHNQPSAWAYKENDNSGRIVSIGSHPEEVNNGERRDFTEASVLYAIEGRGKTIVKGVLQNGVRRLMNKSTLDCDPDYTMIGDLQCHHFMFYIPNDAIGVSVSLQSDADVDMTLMLNQGTFAYQDVARYKSEGNGSNHDFTFSKLNPGIWYVGVQCNTTVDVTETDWGQDYSGRTDVLNGMPYSVKVTWTTPLQEAILH